MGFSFNNRKNKHGAESADSELAAFTEDMISLDDAQDAEGDEYYEEEYPEEEYEEEYEEYPEESEEYYEDSYDDDYSEYEDDRDYFDEDEDYDSEYDTASFDTASLETLSHVDYDTYNDSEFDTRELEADEYVDLDEPAELRYEEPKKINRTAITILIAAACLLLAGIGIYALKEKILGTSPGQSTIRYVTTESGVTIPYSEEMIGAGSQIQGIEVIGGAGLLAALDAGKSLKQTPIPEPDITPDYGESEIITRIGVSIELITVKADLKIRFVNNETGKLIPNVPFKVTVTDPYGKALTWTDDDKDGIIYKSSITDGKYTVHVEQAEGDSYQGYSWPADKSVTVKSTIEYAVVDVEDEIKNAGQVNENTEDTVSRGNTDQQDMSDTTENIDSAQSNDYTEISKDNITDPNPPKPEPSPEEKPEENPEENPEGNPEENPEDKPEEKPEEPSVDMGARLKDNSGNELYVYENDAYREATNADYANFDKFYIISGTKYYGWQSIGGSTYYYDKDGNPVTGTQVIGGVTYQFASDGKLTSAPGVLGIDVSKWQGAIDWNAVKAAGVEFVIIRVGYRGSSAGALIDDSMFTANIQGAKAAGLKVGVYFVTQAINDVEAVYEASMVLDRIKGYTLDYPVFLDVEASGGRGDMIDKATRTAVVTAFCETIRNAGYTAGIYANKTWYGSRMDTSAFGNYVIWVAHYSSVCGYTGRYNVWQYTDKGTLPGINGSVDLNLWYS